MADREEKLSAYFNGNKTYIQIWKDGRFYDELQLFRSNDRGY